MILYLGFTGKKSYVAAMRERGIGRVMVRGHLHLDLLYEGERWFFDNGAFGDWKNEREFDMAQFDANLSTLLQSGMRPQFIVAPDLPADSQSLRHSIDWMMTCPAGFKSGFKWYLAVQDGMVPESVRRAIATPGFFDGLFIGGTDAFKKTAPQWVKLAHTYGLPCHYGRASTPARLHFARVAGCDSADTSFPLWEEKRFWRWLAHGHGTQHVMTDQLQEAQ